MAFREKHTTRDDGEPKQIPMPERVERYKAQQNRLAGLTLVGGLECSHALIDKAFQQLDRNAL
eukprot:552083-Amphidinium_carterae.1